MASSPVEPTTDPAMEHAKSTRRSLRQKTLVSLGITIFILAGLLFSIARWVMLKTFEKIEVEEAQQGLSQAEDGIRESLNSLSNLVTDYSAWDQLYKFAQSPDAKFAKAELPDQLFPDMHINFIVVADSSGNILYARGYDLGTDHPAEVPPQLLAQIRAQGALTRFGNNRSRIEGLMRFDSIPVLVASQPIVRSDYKGPIDGAVIMGRWLDDREVQRLSSTTHLDMSLTSLDAQPPTAQRQNPTSLIHRTHPSIALESDGHGLVASRVLTDLEGKPALLLKVKIPRTVYMQGQVNLLQFMILLLAASATLTAITLAVMERVVLNRIAKLTADVSKIGDSADLSTRIHVPGDDELTLLGASINRMLADLEEAQRERAEQSARFRLMLERMPAILWTTDANLDFISIVGAALEGLKLQPNSLAGISLYDYMESHDPTFPPITAHLSALRGEPSTYSVLWKDRSFECHTEPLRDANKTVVGVIGIALDKTDRMEVEEALRKSESSYRSLIEEAPYGICRCTVGGSFTLVNRALARMLGCENESDLLGLNLGVDIFDDLRDHARFIGWLQEHGSVEGVETQWKQRNGKAFSVHLGGRALRDVRGQIAYFEVIAEDVSDRKHLELQLRQSQKLQAIGQLAGGVAHDFNNLLMVVKGHMELILGSMPTHDPLYPRLDQVQKAANRASSLTRQLLAFSRMQVLQPQVLDLNAIVAGMIQMLSRIIGENIELSFRPAGILGRVKADAGQMEQVLLNLVVNARDAMPGGGRLIIETGNIELDQTYASLHTVVKPGAYVMLAVSDTGCGMDATTQARIFEPFFTTKDTGKGTGLGLSTVYGVIKQSDGYIWVYSEPGQGSTFKVYLPLASESVESAKAATAPIPARGSETILLVEDEENVRSLVRDFLQNNGHTVLEAPNGAEAVRLAESHTGHIDLLVSDVIMPQMSGRELCDELRRRMPDLKVLFISGYTDDAVVRHGVVEGDVAFLQKPFSMRSLLSKIREVLDGTTAAVPSPVSASD
jgi:two-component system, cell cycle sensor histidine kinase and response regulator CckA